MTRTLLTVLAVAGLAACGGGDRQQVATADSLSRDLQLAPVDTSAPLNDQPAADTAPTPPPPAPKPAPQAEAQARAEAGRARACAGCRARTGPRAAGPAVARGRHRDHGRDRRRDSLQQEQGG